LLELQQLRDLRIDRRGTRLSDVADVEPEAAAHGLRAAHGRQAQRRRGHLQGAQSANLVDLSRNVRAEIEELEKDPAMRGINIEVTDDQGLAVTSSLLALAEAGGIGLLLSVIVLYAFLRHWPSTLMVSTAIPICFIMTLGFMYFTGISLNIISMMGLLLAVGMLVDNAVVVVESIYQEREKYPDKPWLASIIGTRHVAIALSAGTCATAWCSCR
jgi:HAE1 family hydrophobic/amphiphilic exporter-1